MKGERPPRGLVGLPERRVDELRGSGITVFSDGRVPSGWLTITDDDYEGPVRQFDLTLLTEGAVEQLRRRFGDKWAIALIPGEDDDTWYGEIAHQPTPSQGYVDVAGLVDTILDLDYGEC